MDYNKYVPVYLEAYDSLPKEVQNTEILEKYKLINNTIFDARQADIEPKIAAIDVLLGLEIWLTINTDTESYDRFMKLAMEEVGLVLGLDSEMVHGYLYGFGDQYSLFALRSTFPQQSSFNFQSPYDVLFRVELWKSLIEMLETTDLTYSCNIYKDQLCALKAISGAVGYYDQEDNNYRDLDVVMGYFERMQNEGLDISTVLGLIDDSRSTQAECGDSETGSLSSYHDELSVVDPKVYDWYPADITVSESAPSSENSVSISGGELEGLDPEVYAWYLAAQSEEGKNYCGLVGEDVNSSVY